MVKKIKGTRVRMGVIGVGGMGQGHCASMKQVRDVKLTAVCDIDPAVAARVGTTHKVPHFVRHRDLIKSGLCDAVLVATPHPPRPPIVVDCATAGLHILSEKPLSERVSTADRMIAAAKKHRVALAVDFQRRFEPEVMAAMAIIRKGGLGRIHRRTLISPEYRSQAYYDSGGWRATWEGEGGGVMMNQSPHVLDLFIQLGGRPAQVIGRTDIRLHRIEVEDLAEAMLVYPDGGTGYFYCSTNESGPGQMIEIFGDKGKLCWRNGELKLYEFRPAISEFTRSSKNMWGGPEWVEKPVKLPRGQRGHFNVVRNFARHLLKGEALVTPGADGIYSLELANAVWLSSYRKKPVKLPLSRSAYDRFLSEMRRKSTFVKDRTRARRVTDPSHGL